MTTVAVVSFLWRDPKAKHTGTYSFGAKHVNSLFRQLAKGAKALEGHHEFRFFLFTDYPDISGFDLTTGLTVIPLWGDYRDLGRCFTRLKLFDPAVRDKYLHGGVVPEAASSAGECERKRADFTVMIDLDVVIIKPEEFLRTLATKNRMQPFLGYRDTKNPRCYSGALWRIDEGHYGRFKNVADTFRHIYDTAVATGTLGEFFAGWNAESSFVGSDQCWITSIIGEHTYPDKLSDRDGIWDFWTVENLPGGELPTNTIAVFVNGMRRDASMKEFQARYPWMVEHWENV